MYIFGYSCYVPTIHTSRLYMYMVAKSMLVINNVDSTWLAIIHELSKACDELIFQTSPVKLFCIVSSLLVHWQVSALG